MKQKSLHITDVAWNILKIAFEIEKARRQQQAGWRHTGVNVSAHMIRSEDPGLCQNMPTQGHVLRSFHQGQVGEVFLWS